MKNSLYLLIFLPFFWGMGACSGDPEPHTAAEFDFIKHSEVFSEFNNRDCPGLGDVSLAKDSFPKFPFVGYLAFVNDEKSLIYSTSNTRGAINDTIWLLDLNNGNRTFLFVGNSVKTYVGNNGKLIANETTNGNIWEIDYNTHQSKLLGIDGRVLAFDPNGRFLAYVKIQDPPNDSYFAIFDLITGLEKWKGDPFGPTPMVWNLSSVLYLSEGDMEGMDVYTLNANDVHPQPKLTYENRPFFNGALAFVDLDNQSILNENTIDFEIIDLKANRKTILIEGCTSQKAGCIAYHPGENQYYFQLWQYELEERNSQDILYTSQCWFTMNSQGEVRAVALDFGIK